MPKISGKESPLLEDMARMAEGAFETLTGFKSELERGCKAQADRVREHLKLPGAEELQLLKAMQAKILDQQEAILKRLEALEARGK